MFLDCFLQFTEKNIRVGNTYKCVQLMFVMTRIKAAKCVNRHATYSASVSRCHKKIWGYSQLRIYRLPPSERAFYYFWSKMARNVLKRMKSKFCDFHFFRYNRSKIEKSNPFDEKKNMRSVLKRIFEFFLCDVQLLRYGRFCILHS